MGKEVAGCVDGDVVEVCFFWVGGADCGMEEGLVEGVFCGIEGLVAIGVTDFRGVGVGVADEADIIMVGEVIDVDAETAVHVAWVFPFFKHGHNCIGFF